MSRKDVRVDIPIGSIDKSVVLADAILAKHIAMGVNSPLTGQVDMTVFGTVITDIKASRTPAISDGRQKEAWNEEALRIIGIGKGQSLQDSGTVYWYINKVHHFFIFKFKGNEEQASLWGFNVVVTQTRGRRNVSFNVPYGSPDGLLELATAIVNKHTTDGAGTIFPSALLDMVAMAARINTAQQLRDDAKTSDENKQAANELARNLCGYGAGQTSETYGTLYYDLTQVRDLLLVVHSLNPEQISLWGFNVVVSSTGGGKKDEPTP